MSYEQKLLISQGEHCNKEKFFFPIYLPKNLIESKQKVLFTPEWYK